MLLNFLLLGFLALGLAADSTPSPLRSKGFAPEEHHLRLPFVHKLSSLPTTFEKHESTPCEGTAFLLEDENFGEFVLPSSITTKYTSASHNYSWRDVERGGAFGLSSLIPAGYNPFGYKITKLGQKFLEFDGSLDSDIGRFLSSVRTRKRFDGIKDQWLEILRVSKKGQSMRIYRSLKELIAFCLEAGFLD